MSISARWKAWWVICLIATGCATTPVPNLQLISRDAVFQYVKRFGYKNERIYYCWQDPGGHVIYIPDQGTRTDERIFLLRADSDEPLIVDIPDWNPRKTYWVDGHGRLMYLPSYAFNEYDPNVETDCDYQSGYFFQYDHHGGVIYISQMARAIGWLFSIKTTTGFAPFHVFGSSENICLIDPIDRETPPFAYGLVRKNCWVFAREAKKGGQFVKIDELSIPGWIEYINPEGNRFLCRGYGAMPFPGHPFVYDVQQRKVDRIDTDDCLPLFLDGNWLNSRLKTLKR